MSWPRPSRPRRLAGGAGPGAGRARPEPTASEHAAGVALRDALRTVLLPQWAHADPGGDGQALERAAQHGGLVGALRGRRHASASLARDAGSRRCAGAAARAGRGRSGDGSWQRVKACSAEGLSVGVLRRLAQPVGPLVRHGGVWQPDHKVRAYRSKRSALNASWGPHGCGPHGSDTGAVPSVSRSRRSSPWRA